MAEYIKREAFVAWLKRIPLKDLSEGRGLCRIIMEEDFKRAIRELPREVIADVAPVVHGQWLLRHEGYGHYWECSVCRKNPCIYVTKDTNYCPNCGARMDADTERSNT